MEDKIESQRQKKVAELKASGKKGTPVTPETFRAWQERKRKRKADAARKLVEAELKKKKGGKGLAVLSGRDLYEYKKDLFEIDPEMEAEAAKATADETTNGSAAAAPAAPIDEVAQVVEKVENVLFLEGDDDDLDDLDDLDDDWIQLALEHNYLESV